MPNTLPLTSADGTEIRTISIAGKNGEGHENGMPVRILLNLKPSDEAPRSAYYRQDPEQGPSEMDEFGPLPFEMINSTKVHELHTSMKDEYENGMPIRVFLELEHPGGVFRQRHYVQE